jgi:hypothetical protein
MLGGVVSLRFPRVFGTAQHVAVLIQTKMDFSFYNEMILELLHTFVIFPSMRPGKAFN